MTKGFHVRGTRSRFTKETEDKQPRTHRKFRINSVSSNVIATFPDRRKFIAASDKFCRYL